MRDRLDSSGRAGLDVRHFENALHLRPLADSETLLYDEAIDCSLLIFLEIRIYSMIKKLINLLVNQYVNLSRIVIVLIAVICISLLFPRSNFKYDFEEGKLWLYDDLNAPISFAIQKSSEEIAEEQKNIKNSFIPLYYRDTTVGIAQIDAFQADAERYFELAQLDSTSTLTPQIINDYIDNGAALLDILYERGILKFEPIHQESGIRQLLLEQDDISEKTNITSFYTTVSAFEALLKQVGINKDLEVNILVPLLQNRIENNVFYDVEATEKLLEEEMSSILPIRGKVQIGEKIVANRQVINKDIYQKLLSLKQVYEDRGNTGQNPLWAYFGYFIITALMLFSFVFLVRFFKLNIFYNTRALAFIFSLLFIVLFLVRSIEGMGEPSLLYGIPFCILPIILRTFFGELVAFFVFVILILLCGFMMPLSFDFLLLQFIAGTVAILTSIGTYYWSQFFKSVALILGAYCLGYIALSMIQNGSILNLDYTRFGPLFINALLTLLAFPLIPFFERIFGFVSNLTLFELSDVNKPLLKELSDKAPGSFWHSIQVASIAEKAANAVNANALLAKVGALYHDIGKMDKPIYFIENQNSDINPHDDLSAIESAQIIISHVTSGISKAKKYGLPNEIIDFIRTHHGETKVAYFLKQYKKENPEEEVDEKYFVYPGPIPFSKETAIVMMADSIEAASMSLQNPNEHQIDELVDSIIQGKIDAEQFVNCDLSFKDIKIISKVFKKMLKSKYHIRISY